MPDDSAATRYPSYDVLAKWSSPDWDEQTRAVVRERLEHVPAIRFFTAAEVKLLEAVAQRIVPPPARDAPIPIVAWIDAKLADDLRDGYRYEELPPQREAWRQGLSAIAETARALYGSAFTDLEPSRQDDVLRRIARGDQPARRFFRDVLCLTIVKTYYGHPRAWNEIGYSGPAAVRGHVRNWDGGVDPWDAHEDAAS